MDLHRPVDPNKTYAEMSSEEKIRYDHMKMHELHKGHESMHMSMVMVLVLTLIVAQVVLVEWKKRHYRSYSCALLSTLMMIRSAQCEQLQDGVWHQIVKKLSKTSPEQDHRPEVAHVVPSETCHIRVDDNTSYKTFFTMLGMWVIPAGLCVRNSWWRFIVTWVMFTLITGIVLRKATYKPINVTTPRLVYKWFYLIYKVSCFVGVLGYIIMMLTLFGVNLMFRQKPQDWMDYAILFLFYGLYYGVLGRDVAEYCTDKMASSIGYYRQEGMPTRQLDSNVCSVCGNPLLVSLGQEGVLENTYKLTCGHQFHEFCIRGWCIIGKKQTCPYCKEKVDLKRMFTNPWDGPHILYGQLLDWIRWLVAWQPLILFLVQGINWALGLE